jgi:tetratricopeptide (TPR) repeat protein
MGRFMETSYLLNSLDQPISERPGAKAFRDPEAALPLAQRAVKLAGNQADCLNTLGVVYYRLGRWDDAIKTLQAAANCRAEGAGGGELLFLAMSYQKGGRPDAASDQFDRATRWWTQAQLTAQQAEGQFESAVEQFDEVERIGTLKAWDWLFRALCHARLNLLKSIWPTRGDFPCGFRLA